MQKMVLFKSSFVDDNLGIIFIYEFKFGDYFDKRESKFSKELN